MTSKVSSLLRCYVISNGKQTHTFRRLHCSFNSVRIQHFIQRNILKVLNITYKAARTDFFLFKDFQSSCVMFLFFPPFGWMVLIINRIDALFEKVQENHTHTHTHTHIYRYTRVVTLIVATIHLQLIQNRYRLRSFTVLQCSHQHCVQPVASDVEVVGYLQQRLLC